MPPQQFFLNTDDVRLSWFQWGMQDGPVVLLVHATGMHGRVWTETVAALPAGCRVLAIDLRGHGDSRYDGYLLDWRMMGRDVINFVTSLGLRDIVGVGHSMGGHAIAQAALALPGIFRELLLVDPVIFPPDRYHLDSAFSRGDPTDNPIARRRNHFANWQDMLTLFQARPPYSQWQPAALADYCRYGLTAAGNGDGYQLACAPAVEASVYMGHCSVDLTDRLAELALPVTVMRARPPGPRQVGRIDFSASPTWEGLADHLPAGRDIFLPELTHFIPMQEPELVAENITRALPKKDAGP